MKSIIKYFFTFAVFFLPVEGFSQPDDNISIGKIDTVRSKYLNETVRLAIYLPASAKSPMFSKTVYPVVYLLDGPSHFLTVTAILQYLSMSSGNSILPEMIVVGIATSDRIRDLTPTHTTSSHLSLTPQQLQSSGGADNFLDFINKELMPYMEESYPVAPYRMLIGHSLGGLFTIHTLVNRPDMFSSYVAIDPSLWWDDQKVLKATLAAMEQNKLAKKPIYLAIANSTNTSNEIKKIEKDTTKASTGMRATLRFATSMDKYKTDRDLWQWKYYPEDTHGSVPFIALYDAFRTIFEGHMLQMPADPEDVNAALFKSHYNKLSDLLGYKIYPPVWQINNFGNKFLKSGKPEKAYEFFSMNIENYPDSFLVYDSMGDYYVEQGDKEKAIEHFEKALLLKEIPQIRLKLDKLTGGGSK